MTLLNEKEQALLEANGKTLVKENQKKNGNGFREPDHRLETPGFPEVEAGIYIADAKSKNAGAVYFDIRRIGEEGKRYKTLRLDQDFYGSILAHAMIAEKLSQDKTITASEREQLEELAGSIADAVVKIVLPEKATTQQVNGEAVSPFSKAA